MTAIETRAGRNAAQSKSRQGATHTSYDSAMWPSLLTQFTQRNAGRHATVIVDGADIGALVQVLDVPFIGADYDHRDGRVDLMLGDFTGSERHLTRSICGPDSVSVLRAPDAKDQALCVTYDGGQTVMTFKS